MCDALVELFCEKWGEGARWENKAEKDAPHEAAFLKLDSTKLKTALGWKPRWGIDRAVELVCDWSRAWLSGGDVSAEMDREIGAYLKGETP